MTSTPLFGKLQEHELELKRLEKHVNQEKKSKGISLKLDIKEEQEDDALEEDENSVLLVKRLGKLFGNNEKFLNYAKRKNFFRKKDASIQHQCHLLWMWKAMTHKDGLSKTHQEERLQK